MGTPASPVIADLFMIELENRTFRSCTTVTPPRKWFRFVDDVISILKKPTRNSFLHNEHLHTENDKIRFTTESEKDGSFPYRDVLS